MYQSPEYQALLSVARSYQQMQEASQEEPDERLKKQDEEKARRLAARKPIKKKEEPTGTAAERMEKAGQKLEDDKKKAEERRAKLKAKFGGRQGRIARRPGDLAGDDMMAMDGNKRAAKRMMQRGKIEDAKQEGEERKKRKAEGKDNDPPKGKTTRLPRKEEYEMEDRYYAKKY